MIYSPTITTLANTSKAGRLRTRLDVILGLLYQVDIEFPPGSSGLLHAVIHDGAYQLYPSDSGSSFTGDNSRVSFPDLYFKLDMPASFDILTWNLDDTYDHTLTVRLGMASKEEYQARFLGGIPPKEITTLLSQIQETQESTRGARIKALAAILGKTGA
jgi:hypothetical protein